MMKTTTKRALWLFLLLFVPKIIFAQDNDFGLWFDFSTEHKLANKLALDLSADLRTYEDASKIGEAFLEGGLTYKFNKYLSAGASYRYTAFREDDDLFHPRHKWFATVTGKLPLANFDITGRFKFQQRYKTYYEDEEDKEPDEHIRIKLKTLYNIPSFPVNPYISSEVFIPIFNESDRDVDKFRFMAGVEYKISKKHSIELEYMFERDFFPHIWDINVISLNYKLEF
jgi:opacity protein-like surface antigen